MRENDGRSFGHWSSGAKKRSAKPDQSNDKAAGQPGGRPPGQKPPDPVHDNLETIAGRRGNRERLIETPLPPGPAEKPPLRETLKRLAERRAKGEESGDLTDPMWDRVVEIAKPLLTDSPATPPRSPAARPTARQRRTPER